jgi:inactivated superfamily I helicase
VEDACHAYDRFEVFKIEAMFTDNDTVVLLRLNEACWPTEKERGMFSKQQSH